jgi:hypothetical protein
LEIEMAKAADIFNALASTGETEDAAEYIAGRFDGLSTGPRMLYSFEEQEGIPVDGSSKMPRMLSPFTIRLVPPSTGDIPPEFLSSSSTNVDLIGSASKSVSYNNDAAAAVLSAYGINSSVDGSSQVADTLEQQISQGQAINTASGTQIRTTLTDSLTAMDIAAQVARILDTPPLTLLINPTDMSISYVGVQNYSERGREGYIFQRWGEEQPTIKFSGSTGAFIAGEDPGNAASLLGVNLGRFDSLGAIHSQMSGETTTPTGVQFASKRNSAAFQNFQALYQFYRNNGYIYDTVGGSEAHLMVGAVAIDYDQWTYVGHIEGFEYAYDSSDPHRIVWSMEFVVGAMYDHAQSTYAVLPMSSPIPNPSDPGGGGDHGTRGDGSWFNLSGAESEQGGISGTLGEEFAQFHFWGSEDRGETATRGNQMSSTNPDGTDFDVG